MSVSCFLCETCIKTKKTQKKFLNNLLNLTCFENFDKKIQLNYICEPCGKSDMSFVKIYDFMGCENHNLNGKNLFVSDVNIYVSEQNAKQILRQINKKQKITQRKEELMSTIKKLRIEYNKPICDEYIKFGKTDFKDVIKKLTDLQTKKNERLFNLLNELQKNNVEYDSRIPSFQTYILKGGCLKKTIEKGKLEQTLALNTDYLSLLQNDIDSETAIELSISNFPNEINNEIVNQFIKNKNKIEF